MKDFSFWCAGWECRFYRQNDSFQILTPLLSTYMQNFGQLKYFLFQLPQRQWTNTCCRMKKINACKTIRTEAGKPRKSEVRYVQGWFTVCDVSSPSFIVFIVSLTWQDAATVPSITCTNNIWPSNELKRKKLFYFMLLILKGKKVFPSHFFFMCLRLVREGGKASIMILRLSYNFCQQSRSRGSTKDECSLAINDIRIILFKVVKLLTVAQVISSRAEMWKKKVWTFC